MAHFNQTRPKSNANENFACDQIADFDTEYDLDEVFAPANAGVLASVAA